MLRGTNKRALSGVHMWKTEKGGVIIMPRVVSSLSHIIIVIVGVYVLISVISFHLVTVMTYIIISQFGLLLDVCSCALCVLFVCFLPQTLGKLREKSSILFSSSGPDYWGTINPEWALCHKGKQQSPIDIEPSRLLYDPNLKHLKIESTYVSTNSFKIHT